MWGPGDGYAGIDELVCQFDGVERSRPWWTIQDLTGDVVALVDRQGSGPASAVWQCTYEPYGGVLAAPRRGGS